MSKLLVIPSSLEQIDKISNLADGFILCIEHLSINGNFYISINKLEQIVTKIKQYNKEVFVSINKNMFNDDLDYLENSLLKIDKMNIDGILYYDLSVLSLVKKLNLNLNLIWSQEHLTTNYLTCNYYEKQGVKGVYLSSEITLEEILKINKNTNLKTIVPIFGYLPMFNSKRHIVKNYLSHFNLKDESKINYIEKENNNYPIIDNNLGTTVYDSHILNGINEYLILKKNNIDYVTLNSFNIDDEQFNEVLEMFNNVNSENKEDFDKKINEMFNADKGFLYKETIYKVKK